MFIFNDWEVKQKQEELELLQRQRARHGWTQEEQTESVINWILGSFIAKESSAAERNDNVKITQKAS